jgi:hypothetical protein
MKITNLKTLPTLAIACLRKVDLPAIINLYDQQKSEMEERIGLQREPK